MKKDFKELALQQVLNTGKQLGINQSKRTAVTRIKLKFLVDSYKALTNKHLISKPILWSGCMPNGSPFFYTLKLGGIRGEKSEF